MQVEGPARINSSRASASPKSNKHSTNAMHSSRTHDPKDSDDLTATLAPIASNAGSSSEDHAKDSSPSNDSRRRAQKTSTRRRSHQQGASPLGDRRGQSSADDHASGSISPRDQDCEYSAAASITTPTRVCHRSTLSRSGGASGNGSGGSGVGRRAGWSTPDDHMEQQRHPELASRVTTPLSPTVAPTTKRVEPSTTSTAESKHAPESSGNTSPSRGRTRTLIGASEASYSESGHTRGSTQRAQDVNLSNGHNGQTRPSTYANDSDDNSSADDGNGASERRHAQPQSPRDSAQDKPARSSEQRSRPRTVTHLSTASVGSRRPPPCHHHHHHRHHNHNHSISHTSRTTQNSPSSSTTRAAHNHTHTRNFSSPSLLDSFTSPEPMLSPIQSYFGSDPNSPASSFSLPRHDHYPRLSIDQSLDSSGASPMDGYHGFATHIWSEQSTTPAHALSHRWTRRMSQPDAYPSLSRSVHHLAQENLRSSVLRSTSTALPRTFAPAAMDQPWSEVPLDRELSTASDDIYDVDHDLVSGEDAAQDSADEGTMDDSYGDYESTYDHNYDHNHNLRNWDEDDEIHDDETYPYGYQVPSVDAQADVDMNDGEDEDLDSDQHLDEIIGSSRQDPSHGGLLIRSEMDDMSEEESEMVHILGFDRQQSSSATMLYGHAPTTTPSSPDSASSQQPSSDDTNRSVVSDEALARSLQEEEYARLMGERRSISSTLLASNSLFRSSPDSPRWPSDYRSALGLTYSTAYPDRSRYQSATRSNNSTRTEADHRRRVFRAMASSSSGGRRLSSGSGGGGGGSGGGGGGGDLGRSRGRPSSARSAFIESHNASSRLLNRPARGRRSRSPPAQYQQQLHHQDLPSDLTRTLQNTSLILDLLDQFTQRLENGMLDRMWGNPEDYLNDDQVDDSYEGLLRLSERIGQAKAKGVSEQTLRDMDKHIASWSRVKAIKAALPSSAASTSTSTSTSSTSSADDGVDENCTICLQTYKLPDLLRTLPCRHGFHVDCIDTWLQTSAQCPICRQEVTAAAVASMECI